MYTAGRDGKPTRLDTFEYGLHTNPHELDNFHQRLVDFIAGLFFIQPGTREFGEVLQKLLDIVGQRRVDGKLGPAESVQETLTPLRQRGYAEPIVGAIIRQ
jgi:hypothetical protein